MHQADSPILTVEEYAHLVEPDDVRSELVRGKLVREPRPGARHGWVQPRLARLLARHVEEMGLGGAVFTDVGIVLSRDPPTVRGPDVAYVSQPRLPEVLDDAFLEVVPDLVVEVVSPSNRTGETQEKVAEYLDTGARLVWVVDPGAGIATVYRSLQDAEVVRAQGVLDGGDVLPGLRIPLSDLVPD